MNNKSFAFTLAETLIVIGIIGVVAALTLPNLNSSTGDKETVVRVQKTYSELNDAIGRAVATYGSYNTWPNIAACNLNADNDCRKMVGKRILEFMKVTRNCEAVHNSTCFILDDGGNGGVMINFLGQKKGWYCNQPGCTKAILASGVSISICSYQPRIYIDVDGPNKGMNAFGDDIFLFNFDKKNNDLKPSGPDYIADPNKLPCDSDNDNCAAWVIMNGNMDYKKTTDGKTCKDSSIVLNWTSNFTCK